MQNNMQEFYRRVLFQGFPIIKIIKNNNINYNLTIHCTSKEYRGYFCSYEITPEKFSWRSAWYGDR